MKSCGGCGHEYPLEEFSKRTKVCKTCKCAYNRQRFGITMEQYNARLIEQGGGCAICGMTPEENGQALAVDHDHGCCPSRSKACGKCFRGLLCRRCNLGIGYFDTQTCERALSYLSRNAVVSV